MTVPIPINRVVLALALCLFVSPGQAAHGFQGTDKVPDLTSIEHLVGKGFGQVDLDPVWLNDHQVLGWKDRSYLHYDAFVLDVATGKRAEPAGLVKALKAYPERWDGWVNPSPDGKWLLYPHGGRQDLQGYLTFSTDGKTASTVAHHEYPMPHTVWKQDSSGFVVISSDHAASGWAALHFSAQTGKLTNKVSMPDIPDKFETTGSMFYGYNGIYPLGADGTGHIVFIPYGHERTDIRVFVSDASTGKGPVVRHVVRLPAGTRLHEVRLNPAGDTLAWLLYRDKPGRSRLARVELWLSGIDGKRLREVGSISVQRLQKGRVFDYDFPLRLGWTLDGKSVSYVREGALYTVPARK